MLQVRDVPGLERAQARHRQFRHQRGQHLDIVRFAKTACRHEDADTGLIERVFELTQPVGRVDIDEDRANLRRSVLHDRPLCSVRAPDPDPVSPFDAQGQQRARRTVHFPKQVGVGVAQILMAGDQRVSIPEPGSRTVERGANRFTEKCDGPRTMDIRQHHDHLCVRARLEACGAHRPYSLSVLRYATLFGMCPQGSALSSSM